MDIITKSSDNQFLPGKQGIYLACLLIIPLFSCNSNNDSPTVMKGNFIQSVIETGELEAMSATYINMPQISWQYGYQFKIIGLAEHGKLVHKGDSVIKFDPSSVYKAIIDLEDKLENEIAATKKQDVQSENNIQDLNAQLKNEQASYDLKKLEVERSRFDTEVKKKIKELEFQQATIKLIKVKRNLELKPFLDGYDKKIQRIKVIQRQTDIKDAKQALKRFLVRAPGDGTFQVAYNRFTQNPGIFRLGDQPYGGQMIASIPDISKMKVKSHINEADFHKMYRGLKVLVRLDALPSVPFKGTVTNISKICLPLNKEKVFDINVEIEGSDLRLKPGMTVNCEYILYESDNDLFIPNNCLLSEKGHYYIFLKKGSSQKKVEVEAVISNAKYTIIKADVRPGQKVIPFAEVLNNTKS